MKYVMHGLGVTVALAAAMLLEAKPAAVQELSGPYLGLGAGANFQRGLSAAGPLGAKTSLNYDVGPVATAEIGYALGNGFRWELDLGYRRSDTKDVTIPSGATLPTALNLRTNAQTLNFMVDALYDVRLPPPWTVYLGVGVGAADIRVDNVGHDRPFAFQAMTGVEYALTPLVKLGLQYKFLGTEGVKLKSNAFFTGNPSYYDHAVLLTLRYAFPAPPPLRGQGG